MCTFILVDCTPQLKHTAHDYAVKQFPHIAALIMPPMFAPAAPPPPPPPPTTTPPTPGASPAAPVADHTLFNRPLSSPTYAPYQAAGSGQPAFGPASGGGTATAYGAVTGPYAAAAQTAYAPQPSQAAAGAGGAGTGPSSNSNNNDYYYDYYAQYQQQQAQAGSDQAGGQYAGGQYASPAYPPAGPYDRATQAAATTAGVAPFQHLPTQQAVAAGTLAGAGSMSGKSAADAAMEQLQRLTIGRHNLEAAAAADAAVAAVPAATSSPSPQQQQQQAGGKPQQSGGGGGGGPLGFIAGLAAAAINKAQQHQEQQRQQRQQQQQQQNQQGGGGGSAAGTQLPSQQSSTSGAAYSGPPGRVYSYEAISQATHVRGQTRCLLFIVARIQLQVAD